MKLDTRDIEPGALIVHVDERRAVHNIELLCLSEPNDNSERAYLVVLVPPGMDDFDAQIIWLDDNHILAHYHKRIV